MKFKAAEKVYLRGELLKWINEYSNKHKVPKSEIIRDCIREFKNRIESKLKT